MKIQRSGRLEDLERQFSELEGKLKDSPEKEAISVLHAMMIEVRRQGLGGASNQAGANARGQQPQASSNGDRGMTGVTLEEVSQMYKHAPAMEGKAENEGLPVGSQAPDFTLRDANNEEVSLSQFRGQSVVLVFYPLDWSPGCSDQLSLYQSEFEEFEKLGAQVIGISVDSIYSHGAWAAVRGVTFPLLADFQPKGEVARRYKVWRESDGFNERALFVVDGEGVIRFRTVSPELHHIPSIYELLDELKKLAGRAEKAAK
jgi:peroxiredoxin